MKLRILVDSSRSPPRPGELNLVITEASRGKDGELVVHFVKAILQTFMITEDRPAGVWTEVPMEFLSHKANLNVPNAKKKDPGEKREQV